MSDRGLPKDELRDHLFLNPVDLESPTKGIINVFLGKDMFYRETGRYGVIWYLRGAGYVKIPVGWIRIFRSLDVYGGEKVLYTDLTGLDKLDLFIVGLLKFVRSLDIQLESSADLFNTLCSIGTGRFREFLRDSDLPDPGPWTYEEPGKTLEL